MYDIAIETTFQAGHYILLADGKWEQAHKHNWLVRVVVESNKLDGLGLVMDFHHLHNHVKETIFPLTEYKYVNEMEEFSQVNPSTENIARFIYDRITGKLPERVRVREVVLWETKDFRARYRGS